MRAAFIVALAFCGCAGASADRITPLASEVRQLRAEQEATCQRLEEYQAARGGVTHPCRPQSVTVRLPTATVAAGAH
jgi:hypothetical protein